MAEGNERNGIFGWTAMEAINRGKLVTFAFLAICILTHGGLQNMRQVIFTGLQGSYLLYWAGHQAMIPEWKPFAYPATPNTIFLAFAVIGVGYVLPAWLAFSNPHDISPGYAVLCIVVNSLGNFLNVGSDWYKAGAKTAGAGLVSTGPYMRSMRPNYFGDWFRYLGFAMVTGSAWAFLLPAFVAFTNIGAMPAHIESAKQRYGDEFLEYAGRVPAIVPGLWPAVPHGEAKAEAPKKAE